MKYFIQKKAIDLSSKNLIGQGGEAEIFAIDKQTVAKIFKSAQHPSFAHDPAAQKAATERIAQHQKKLKQFPANVPENVLHPKQLVTDRKGKIVGYTMPYLQGAEPLYRYGDRRFREQNGIDHNAIIQLFTQIYQTLQALHQQGIVVGDFNDLNILVENGQPYFIDTDAWQFKTFQCKVFTPRFVDPLLCDRHLKYLDLIQAHNPDSDWYAFAVMLFRCLLYVDLYGGVLPNKQIPQAARPLHRLSIFEPNIKYPKPALHYRVLSDDLIQYFQDCVQQDKRGEFPIALLQQSQWQTCSNCGQIHSRLTCPTCQNTVVANPLVIPEFSGQRLLFETPGTMIATQFTNRAIHYLYWENGEFKRETGVVIFKGDRSSRLQFWIDGNRTYVGQGNTVLTFIGGELQSEMTLQVDRYRQQICFQGVSQRRYWLDQGKLWGDRTLGRGFLGDVLENQTCFWAREDLGFGLYRVGHRLTGFIFDLHRQGLNDQVDMPQIFGEIIDMDCFIGQDIWLLITTQSQGKLQQQIYVFDRKGQRRSQQIFDSSTMPTIHGHCATPQGLLMAMDAGLMLWTVEQNQIQVQQIATEFDDLIQTGQTVHQTPSAIFLADTQKIYQLQITPAIASLLHV